MINRLAIVLPALLLASTAVALPVCPPLSYTGSNIPHVNNPALARQFGPTPAGNEEIGKCGITELYASTGACMDGALSHFAYDIFDFWFDPNPPFNRVFRQSLHVNTFDGIEVGGRLKFAEIVFAAGETVSFYFDREYSWYTYMTVGYRACDQGCPEEEMSRFDFPTGQPLTEAVPLTITWTTGRYLTLQPSVSWTIGTTLPYNPTHAGWVGLHPGARESSFSNGIVNGSCESTSATRVRFVEPRFEAY